MTDIPIPEFVRRLEENLASFDAEVAYQLSIEGERADLWGEIDVNVEDLRSLLADRAAQAERMARLEAALKPFAECYARYVKRAEEAKAWGNPAPGFSSADRTFSIGALYEAARALSQEGSDA